MIPCTRCRAGVETCLRCERRLCLEHVPFGGDACTTCEIEYQSSRDSVPTGTWFLAAFVLPWILFAWSFDEIQNMRVVGGVRSFSTGIPVLDAFVMTTVLAVLLGKAAVGLRTWVHRRQFLAQRPLPRARAARLS